MYQFSRVLLFISCATTLASPHPDKIVPSLKLYQSPDTHSQIISTISPQEGVTIVPVTWVQIRDPHTQKLGWVQQDALRMALQQNPIDIQQITTKTQGPYQEVSTIRTITNTTDNSASIETAQKQHEAIQDNVKQAFQQIRAMEATLFDDREYPTEQHWQEPSPQHNTLWSTIFNWSSSR